MALHSVLEYCGSVSSFASFQQVVMTDIIFGGGVVTVKIILFHRVAMVKIRKNLLSRDS